MRLTFPRRVIEPEWLDDAPPERSRASLNDLERLNRRWGGYGSLRRLLDGAIPDRHAPFSLLDVGAATGDMARAIKRLRPRAHVTCLDYRIHHLRGAPDPKAVGDAFHLPFRDRAFDFAFSSLFLHHFQDARVIELLLEFARVARTAVLAVDLQRHPIAHAFVPMTRSVFGWDPITVHDAPVSVAAAFVSGELERLARAAGLRPDVRSNGFAFRWTLCAWCSSTA